jgi:uncharacterized DUF497 family protein
LGSRKSDRTLVERGFDFLFAILIFKGAVVEHPDIRHSYGEERFVANGVADGELLTVVYTDRVYSDDIVVRRIISARRASKHERQAYQATYPRLYAETDPGPR